MIKNPFDRFPNIKELKKFTDSYGKIYDTQESAIHLYSWVRLLKPKTIVEFGTGTAVSTLWMAAGLKENNNNGKIYTYDNGAFWNQALHQYEKKFQLPYQDYIENLKSEFDLQNIVFNNEDIDFSKVDVGDIDMVFSDFNHSPMTIASLLANILPKMSDRSLIFIDSVPGKLYSYTFLTNLVELLNKNKPIKSLIEISSDPDKLTNFISRSSFSLTHILKSKASNQTGISILQINPNDFIICDKGQLIF